MYWYNVYMVERTGELGIGSPYDSKEAAISTIEQCYYNSKVKYVTYIHTLQSDAVENVQSIHWSIERAWARSQEHYLK